MKIIKFKAVTPSQRHLILVNKKLLNKVFLLKSQIIGIKNSSGRNFTGKITSYHKGGGRKKKYRQIDFFRQKNNIGIVISIEYDPFRTANIAAVYNFLLNYYFYIVAPINLKIGDIIKSGIKAESKLGHSLPLKKIPVGTFIHNLSVKKKKAQFTRAAGTFSQLIEKSIKYCKIKLNSGEQRLVLSNCFATIGIVSNENNFLIKKGKAGRSRWLNKRPKVRGVAKNPIDHPHGGGEGKTSGGRTSVTPWGKPTKNKATSKSKNKLILTKKVF